MMKIVSPSSVEPNCVVCGEACPSPIKRTRWGSARKYCSSKCTKTAYRQRNPQADAASKRKYAESNKEKRVQQTDRWRRANPAYYTEYASLRTRNLEQAKPKWLSELELLWIEEIYDLARIEGKEVDHVVPLKHSKVCGLHVPWNLQLLTRSENASKSNKFDEDVVAIIRKEAKNG